MYDGISDFHISQQKKLYGLAAFIFIATISIQDLLHVIFFGMGSGFAYYFFNMATLIIYTNWKGVYKLIGVLCEILLLCLSFYISTAYTPIILLSFNMTVFFHILNIILNVAGVANSANYYVNIANNAQKELAQLAMTDHLTSLPNRAAFHSFFEDMKQDNSLKNQNIGIMMVDIDHFKKINDTFGHLCGDEILKQTASLLNNSRQANGIVARYGGEEFTYVSLFNHIEDFKAIAEKLCKIIEENQFVFEEKTFRITVSIGALFCSNGCNLTQDKSLALADNLLYQAKEEGRNRVVFKEL